MSLIEPLLPKEELKDQKLEKSPNDPLANVEKSIKELSVEFKSYEIDATSDIAFRDANSEEMKKFYGTYSKTMDIVSATTFENKLAIGRIDGIIKIYDLVTKEETILKGHSNAVNCLQVTSRNEFLLSGSRDKSIIIWNLKTYKGEKVLKADIEVFCLAIAWKYIFAGSLSDGLIRKWIFYSENEASTLNGHKGGITCIKSTKNNQFLVSGSMDKSLRIWNIENNQDLKSSTSIVKQFTKLKLQKMISIWFL